MRARATSQTRSMTSRARAPFRLRIGEMRSATIEYQAAAGLEAAPPRAIVRERVRAVSKEEQEKKEEKNAFKSTRRRLKQVISRTLRAAAVSHSRARDLRRPSANGLK